ncbi:DUF6259 domain-containing protein [Paenibacillus solisilvae]|uniref:DUF6259 domain-containing protein n=1 Tax=Paenibacillus solisilvae TaxID=2486751 RepID=A0ABW0VY45_9BACL
MIELTNGVIRVGISETDGSIRSIRDERSGMEYIAAGTGGDSFRLETDRETSGAFLNFSCKKSSTADKQEAELTWMAINGVKVNARITVAAGKDEIEFSCEADNEPGAGMISLEYPIIPDLRTITDEGKDDYVAHSFATGFKVRNPMANFEHEGPGLRFMPYPESFSGASMQFFSYYGMGRGGLYFAALDGEGYAKWLNFYKNRGGLLEASFIHGCEDIGPGKGLQIPYSVIVRPLEGKDWYEAADLYRSWAERQDWCAKGKLTERAEEEACRWLHEEIGVATFGINAGSDRTKWLHKYHEYIRTPMFHILGPDWTNAPQTFYKGVPGGFDDWFPTRFNRDNIDCMRDYGDKFAPFEFDYLFHFDGADGNRGKEAAQRFPEHKKSIDGYRFPFICPAHSYTQDLHIRRDETLQRSDQVDSIYYDISANNILKVCLDDSHGHPVGAGREIADAYKDNYIRTKEAMIKEAGKYVPMGTEMMNELYLDVLDYYQARAGAQPAAPLEGYLLRGLLKTGDAELIPMFTYVYHEYGALRMDGWGKLVEEIGTLYYFTVARTYLWGGLYELNYEYSPLEALDDGTENPPDEHYYPFEPRGYKFSADRARYLAMFAELRTGIGSKYLAYGRMLHPLDFECGKLRMNWFHYNHGKETKEYNDSGELTVDSVVHAAWRYKDESVGLFFANVSGECRKVTIDVGPEKLGLSATVCKRHVLQAGTAAAGCFDISLDEAGEIAFDIPQRSVILLEFS